MTTMQTSSRLNETTSVLMLPWLAHGHTCPFLELAKKLGERNFVVYLCSTAANLVSVKEKVVNMMSSSKRNCNKFEVVEFHLPELPELPSRLHTTNGLPPDLMPSLKTAFDMAAFAQILQDLSPDLVIYDFLQPWAPLLASQRNIPAVEFLSCSASMSSFVVHLLQKPGLEFPFPEMHLRDHEVGKFKKLVMESSSSNGVNDIEGRAKKCTELSNDIVLCKTFREIEGKYMDYLSRLVGKKIVPVGALVDEDEDEDEGQDQALQWLINNSNSSGGCPCVFVSFGSEYFLSKEEIREIAEGLELSGVSFIWVVRFPKSQEQELEEALPEGFLARIKNSGIIVKGWAPQRAILRSGRVAGFVSHCGWSSVMESMRYGVPIIAAPMQLDQPLNARLVEDLGLGLEVASGTAAETGRTFINRHQLSQVIRKVVLDHTTRDPFRRRALQLSHIIKTKGDHDIDQLVTHLLQLCNNPDFHFNTSK